MKKNIISHSEEETIAVGEKLSRYLKKGDIVCLYGDLGSGKTTLVKGIARGKSFPPDSVNSPTFVIMNIYQAKPTLFHLDLYRLGSENAEIARLGYEEFLYGEGIAVIEWAENLGDLMPKEYLRVELKHRDDGGRDISLVSIGKKYEAELKKLHA